MRKLIKGQNDLETWCKQNNREDLLVEWRSASNGDLKPSNFLPASNKTVWWRCSQGHEWQAKIENRVVLGRNCPYCYGRYAVKGENDLQTLFPEIAKEWHPTKNGHLLPSDVKANTNKKVWWQCKFGHEWQAIIESRTIGSGCPYCSNKKILKGFNDLATTNPELIDEWDYEKNGKLTPYNVGSGSNKKVWWQCEYGHEWKTAIANRTKSNRTGCPYCTGAGSSMPEQGIAYYLEKVCKIEQRAKIDGKEVDIFLPEYSIGVEYDGILYHEGKEERDMQKTMHMAIKGVHLIRIKESTVNEVIGNHIILFDGNRMNANYAWALKQLLVLLCSLTNNDSFATISIDLNTDMVKIREKFKLYKVENSLANTNPDLIKEWNSMRNGRLRPDMFFSGTHQKVWWKCSQGHEWQAAINSRVAGVGCPYCAGQRVIEGETDLQTLFPEIAEEWNYEKNKHLKDGFGKDISTPFAISAGSPIKVWWKGSCGHEWKESVYKRSKRNFGCPYCSNQRLLTGYNDLGTVYPDIATEWNYEKNGDLKPCDFIAGSNKTVWWKCSNGHEWKTSISNRTGKARTNCPYCSGLLAIKGETDLATTSPELASEWNYERNGDLTPNDVKLMSNRKVWWKGSCGHEWEAGIEHRANGNACPYCSGKRILVGFNDLATTNPDLAVEWNYEKNNGLKNRRGEDISTPEKVNAGSNQKVWWKCKYGHEWNVSVIDRTRQNSGCPYCGNHKVLSGFNDLVTTNPEIAAEWNYEKNIGLKNGHGEDISTPDQINAGSNLKVWWRCAKGHEYEARISQRIRLHSGCPYCHGGVSRKVQCIETGIVYSSATKAAKQVGISQSCVSACCNGKQKTAGGYHWKYYS